MGSHEFSLAASAARTASGQGTEVDGLSGVRAMNARFCLDITAASGTPTLDLVIEAFVGGQWFVVGTFTQKTGTGVDSIVVTACPSRLRARWTIGGVTPSLTFSVHGVRVG